MKYAIFMPADQTYVYLSKTGDTTIVHKEAELWDNRSEAERALDAYHLSLPPIYKGFYGGFTHVNSDNLIAQIEEVEDVEEFWSREDTW